MAQRKVSDIDRRFQGLAGIFKLRALMAAEGVLNKDIAKGAGIYPPDVSLWLQGRQDEPDATAWVAQRLGISAEEVERLRNDQQPQPAGAA